ncbi:uncharacterized protein PHACADRAFT_252954 [Phanerochaete carnosa HHB-10118-sp]|uniref:Uncharacterized protein n=1 Tax=Phanerochaete carnosa (strain HHB-10118-sp) TaxID=650164 RepID=K5X6N1_PHACS|nr:uncharacterized protein PHACADRAFT_252954 [Phanerochaete carnosa HHB-10118-sp]EKM58537.1 hypothetical protein PHACADRAFT_252954 [Phanerochaete carnosa HHB-10118-sp]
MIPDMRKAFSRFFREHSCKATSRQVTRAEQDKINPTRKSLMWYTSVTVTPAAQKAYVEKYPAKVEEFKKRREAVLAARNARNASASKTAATQDQPAASDSELKCTATEQPQPSVTQIKKVKA